MKHFVEKYGAEYLREDYIKIEGGQIPIILFKDKEKFYIRIDGINWIETENQMHAVVLYEMMKDNITKYMNYRAI